MSSWGRLERVEEWRRDVCRALRIAIVGRSFIIESLLVLCVYF